MYSMESYRRDLDHGRLHWRDCIAYQCNLRQIYTKHALCGGCISNSISQLRFEILHLSSGLGLFLNSLSKRLRLLILFFTIFGVGSFITFSLKSLIGTISSSTKNPALYQYQYYNQFHLVLHLKFPLNRNANLIFYSL